MSKEPRTCATQQFKRTAVQQEAPMIGYVKRVRGVQVNTKRKVHIENKAGAKIKRVQSKVKMKWVGKIKRV